MLQMVAQVVTEVTKLSNSDRPVAVAVVRAVVQRRQAKLSPLNIQSLLASSLRPATVLRSPEHRPLGVAVHPLNRPATERDDQQVSVVEPSQKRLVVIGIPSGVR